MRRAAITLVTLLFTSIVVPAGQTSREKQITAAEAKDHVGERTTVCGKVVGIRYAASSRGRKIFLDLDVAFPKHIFSILIWLDTARSQFGNYDTNTYNDKNVCVTGLIKSDKEHPEIIASRPEQIKIEAEVYK